MIGFKRKIKVMGRIEARAIGGSTVGIMVSRGQGGLGHRVPGSRFKVQRFIKVLGFRSLGSSEVAQKTVRCYHYVEW